MLLPRPPTASYALLFFVCMGLFVSSMPACTKNQRLDTIRASLIAVNATHEGFAAWDHDHQVAIRDHAPTVEQKTKDIADYRTHRQVVLDGFEVAYQTLLVAAIQTDDLSLTKAVVQADALVKAIRKFIADGGK